MLINWARAGVRQYLLNNGSSIEHHGGRREVADLIRRMWPVRTKHSLKRFGGSGDGAYLLPDDLEGIQAVISPGVASVADFEQEMAERGMDCYLVDASVERPPIDNPRFTFTPKFLGLYDSGVYLTLDTYVDASVPGTSDLMLQMDIEGAEWGVLANVSSRTLNRFRVMAIEFHKLERLLYSDLHRSVLERLLMSHHIVHSHLNNAGEVRWSGDLGLPEYLEVTFLRKDRADPVGFVAQLPHELDVQNVVFRPAVNLPACWYNSAKEGR